MKQSKYQIVISGENVKEVREGVIDLAFEYSLDPFVITEIDADGAFSVYSKKTFEPLLYYHAGIHAQDVIETNDNETLKSALDSLRAMQFETINAIKRIKRHMRKKSNGSV